MANANNVIDIVTRNVAAQFEGAVAQLNAEATAIRERADTAIAETVARIETEGRARLDGVIADLPSATVFGELQTVDLDGFDAFEWIKAQAKSRAWRTLIQGVLSAVLIAFGTAAMQAVFVPGFDFFAWEDWKFALVLGIGAAGTALVSYLQNALGIKPPKVG
ncbi:MAG: hypothetical protein ACOH2Q_23515 [Rhodococcus sp. (in: high G+C Gram-positive bacteria)]